MGLWSQGTPLESMTQKLLRGNISAMGGSGHIVLTGHTRLSRCHLGDGGVLDEFSGRVCGWAYICGRLHKSVVGF